MSVNSPTSAQNDDPQIHVLAPTQGAIAPINTIILDSPNGQDYNDHAGVNVYVDPTGHGTKSDGTPNNTAVPITVFQPRASGNFFKFANPA